jgi:hypothetical protein
MLQSRTRIAIGVAVSGLLAASFLTGARADTLSPRGRHVTRDDGAERADITTSGSSLYPLPQCAQATGGGMKDGFAVLSLVSGPKGGQVAGTVDVSGGKAMAGASFSVLIGIVKGSSSSCTANKGKTLTLDKTGYGSTDVHAAASGPGKYFVLLENQAGPGAKNLASKAMSLS